MGRVFTVRGSQREGESTVLKRFFKILLTENMSGRPANLIKLGLIRVSTYILNALLGLSVHKQAG